MRQTVAYQVLATAILALCVPCCSRSSTAAGAPDGGVDAKDSSLDWHSIESGAEVSSPVEAGDEINTDDAGWQAPAWVDMPGTTAGCQLQRLANRGRVRVFTGWKSCDATPGCEEAILDTRVVPTGGNLSNTSIIRQNDAGTWGVWTVTPPTGYSEPAYITDGDGVVVDGYRTAPNLQPECTFGFSDIRGNRFAVETGWSGTAMGSPVYIGVVMGTIGEAPTTVSLPVQTAVPQQLMLGDAFVVLRWQLPPMITAQSAVDGSGFKILYQAGNGSSVLDVHPSTNSSSRFFFWQDVARDGGSEAWNIGVTDGTSATTPYLDPPVGQDIWYGTPLFSDTHFAWMRGIHRTGDNTFDSVELWASPYSDDPAELQPEKITDWPGTAFLPCGVLGGWGKFAAGTQSAVEDRNCANLASI